MRLVNINYVREGAILAQPVIDSMGRTLLQAGIKLTEVYAQRLRRLGVDEVFIEDDQLDDVEPHLTLKPRTREQAYDTVKSIRHCIETNRLLQVENVRTLIQRMISDLVGENEVLGYLSDVKGYDEYTFHHSVNSTILALVLGMHSGLKEGSLTELGLGTLVHDIGKLKIPTEILNKKGPLTAEEFDEIKRHPTYGYEILRKNSDLGLVAAHVALQHQERWNGSGYPRGLKGDKIHEYGRIAAVADVYEALTSKRSYRNAGQPYEAYEYILAHAGVFFEPKLIHVFAKHIAIYPNGSGVILSNGQRGNVVKQNIGYPNRPIVRMLYQGDEPLNPPQDYNLAEHPSLLIVGVENK